MPSPPAAVALPSSLVVVQCSPRISHGADFGKLVSFIQPTALETHEAVGFHQKLIPFLAES